MEPSVSVTAWTVARTVGGTPAASPSGVPGVAASSQLFFRDGSEPREPRGSWRRRRRAEPARVASVLARGLQHRWRRERRRWRPRWWGVPFPEDAPISGLPWAGRAAGEGSRGAGSPLPKGSPPGCSRPASVAASSAVGYGLGAGVGAGAGAGLVVSAAVGAGGGISAAAPSAAEGSVCSPAARRYSEDSAAETSGADCGAGPRRRRRMNACVTPRGRPRAAWAAAAGWALSDRQTEATTASEQTAGGRRDAKTNTRRLINDRNTIRTCRSRRRETRKSRDGGRVD